ncbi:MAG TPA: sugar phosphate isomerase/epimerase, partial [Tepidisphaeraceae bacterium]
SAKSSSKDPMAKLNWKLGAQAYTFRSLSLMETIDTLKRLDLHYVEMYPGQRFSKENPAKADHNMSDELIAQLKEKLKANDVQAISYGVVELGKDEAANRKVFDFAKKMGMKNVVSEPPQEALPAIDKLCGEYGIKMAIHNHPKPSRYWDCNVEAKAISGTSDRIGSCADIGHWVRSGMQSPECINALKGRVIECHFKDIDQKKEDVVWGTGTVNVAECMKALKQQNKPLFIAIEYEKGSGEELVQNVSKSIEFFKQQAATLADEK